MLPDLINDITWLNYLLAYLVGVPTLGALIACAIIELKREK